MSKPQQFVSAPVSYLKSKTSSQAIGAGPRTQEQLMEALSHELINGVFETTRPIENVYTCPEQLYRPIDEFVAREMAKPRDFSPVERENYIPLQDLLNDILAIIPEHLKKGTYYEKLRFSAYDRPVKDLIDGRSKLQPNLVGSLIEAIIEEWFDVEIAVEVKNRWADLQKQASTYGRAMLEQCLRWFSVVIGFNHASQQFRMMWYTREGSFQTRRLGYRSSDDLTVFVRGLVGLALASASDIGKELFKSRRDAILLSLPVIPKRLSMHPSPLASCVWQVDAVFCQRICILGRATHVYRVVLHDASVMAIEKVFARGLKLNFPDTTDAFITATRLGPYTRARARSVAADREPVVHLQTGVRKRGRQELGDTINAGMAWLLHSARREQRLQPFPDYNFSGIAPFVTDDGETLIVKESWPLRRHSAIESGMFRSVQGQHGIPDVLGSWNVPHHMDVFTGLSPFQHPEDWPPIPKPPSDQSHLPEERVHQFFFMRTEGCPLVKQPDVEIIVHAIVDGIIGMRSHRTSMSTDLRSTGHLNLFLGGYLHRDPAIGNILCRKEVQHRNDTHIQTNNFAQYPMWVEYNPWIVF